MDTAKLSCDAMMASVSELGDSKEILLNGLSNDPTYSFEKAEMFALSGDIGDSKELEIVTREEWGG